VNLFHSHVTGNLPFPQGRCHVLKTINNLNMIDECIRLARFCILVAALAIGGVEPGIRSRLCQAEQIPVLQFEKP
jgi:hypothetical protein